MSRRRHVRPRAGGAGWTGRAASSVAVIRHTVYARRAPGSLAVDDAPAPNDDQPRHGASQGEACRDDRAQAAEARAAAPVVRAGWLARAERAPLEPRARAGEPVLPRVGGAGAVDARRHYDPLVARRAGVGVRRRAGVLSREHVVAVVRHPAGHVRAHDVPRVLLGADRRRGTNAAAP